ncbi:protocadherin Fat 1-like isoform X2 [Alosa sapidissima]|uniref:protocadherin Fat 1-like isoform X2 n=1 Tax=Alosa sapidissima TaxID=34773 RepID=UPI001C09E99E|nr:protocadherin Fat 1-like isoform X2 [Alosa sapidissima]
MMGEYSSVILVMHVLWSCAGTQRQQAFSPLQFTQAHYNVTIYENSAAKTYAEAPPKMGIYLRDRAWDIRYKIDSGDSENMFKADEFLLGDFSFLRIRTKGGSSSTLNREIKDRYELTVTAHERLSRAEAQTRVVVRVLDTNDLRPLFSPTSYSVSVPENTALRTSVGRAAATDADIGTNGQHYFSFRQWTDVFAVHPASGVITLTGKLDYSEAKLYELDILAEDRGLKLYGSIGGSGAEGIGGGGGGSSVAKLTVHVLPANERTPVITAVPVTPWNTTQDPTYAVVTVDDGDPGLNGEIASLTIVAGDPLQQFKVVRMGPGSNEYKIKAVKEVEWEGHQFGYNLTLQAQDRGSPPKFSSVKVVRLQPPQHFIDPPKFERPIYTVRLSEFAPPHTSVIRVRAQPNSPLIRYSLKPRAHQPLGPFTINPNTGLITTTQTVQADHISKYEFEVITSDRQAATKVVVEVIDENNNTPKFTQPYYTVSVNEHVPLGTSVLAISASDADEGENGYVTYTIANVTPLPFHIDYFTGVITTTEDLDYELMHRVFSLRVRASDWGSPFRREAETTVSITLNNLNDNAPLFENIDCQLTVPRSFSVDETIAVISAIDMDDLGVVQYEIKAGNKLGLFGLHPESGILSLKKPLDSGAAVKMTLHTLEIAANDGENSSPPLFMNITVVTGVEQVSSKCVDTGVARDLAGRLLFGSAKRRGEFEESYTDVNLVNQHPPRLMAPPNLLEVKEDVDVGTEILQFRATDADSGFNGKLFFVISGGNLESCFSIDTDTGRLVLDEPLDRETTDQHTLNITVYDLGSPQRSVSHILKIKVLDANDNSPQFQQREYSIEISEDTAVGTDIIQLQATDIDLGANGEVKYSFLTQTDQFHINEKTGIVTVKGMLDRESHASFTLKAAACDRPVDEPELISIVILRVILGDVNDNPPVFSHRLYRARVPEDLPVGSVVAWLEAHDPDAGLAGQVRYSLGDDGDGAFQVDKVSGAVRIWQSLDFEKRQVYNLTVRARDKGKPEPLTSVCHVVLEVVDVNENLHRPTFPFFTNSAYVSEDAPVGTTVLKVMAADKDPGRDGEVRYTIGDGSGLGVFGINEETGVIFTQETLDRETTGQYWLTVYATDQGVVPQSSFVEVYIEVRDINDNVPQTSEPIYYPSVQENSPKDTAVIQIEAFDPDTGSDKLAYRITSGNPQGFFVIDPKTGLVTTTSRKLDREKQEEHTLQITITDSGAPAKSVSVRVIVNVLDENDNAPQFLETVYRIRLPERSRTLAREPVYRVLASDHDTSQNSEISYSIEDGNKQGRFFIDPRSGRVSTREAFSAGEYNVLTIRAVDNGRPQRSSTCRLHVEWIPRPKVPAQALELDKEAPATFTVMESDKVGHMVGVIRTVLTDSPVWFAIKGDVDAKEVFQIVQMASDRNGTAEETGGKDDSRFDVNKGSGTLIVAGPLDAEQNSSYNLTIEATDGSRCITTQVVIKVIDTNEHRPQFSQAVYEISIPEETQAGAKILEILATDKDLKSKLSYTLLSSTDPLSLQKFRLDPGTGYLYTTEPLDHEVMKRHTLTVMVRDQDIPVKRNLVRVIVNVEDNNDNAPSFTSPRYTGRVLETAALGTVVAQVTALDKDKGVNAELLYSIDSGNEGNKFAIDAFSGMITVAKELDSSSESRFMLTIKAFDQGEPPRSAETTVHISVTISDNAKPKFALEEISAEISEAAPVGSLVTVVEASSQSSVTYQIKEGNIDFAFAINPNSGAIVTLKPLDYETKSLYKLIVQGTNMAGFESNMTVLVHIKDENDNAPFFTKAEYFGTISESAAIKSLVLTDGNTPLVIQATDMDTDLNGRLVYEIVEPDARNYFALDSSTGAFQTASELDYEQRTTFQFTVQAHDTGAPRLFTSNTARVTIQVIDANDCTPKFSQDLYEATLLLPAYQGVRVIAVNATDNDSLANAKLLFSISDGNIGDKFRIDAVSGGIFIQNATQLRSRYRLTVRVSDGRWQSTSVVKVAVKENKDPNLQFTQKIYTAVVRENSSERKTLAIVSTVGRKTNEPLFYTILNQDGHFEIGQTSGVLFTTGKPFDREEQDMYEVVVGITREPKSPKVVSHVLVRVTIEDVNDSPPVFVNLPYHALVQIDAEVGQIIRQMSAVDQDTGRNAEVKYLLNEHKYFQMSSSGDITLKRPFDLETLNTKFVLSVVAQDGGEPALSSTVEVEVTVLNKAAPIFEKPFYNIEISENTLPHTSILQVQVNGLNGPRAVYSIFEGDPLSHFSISFNSGVISVVQTLDYEVHPAYKLRVRATDAVTGSHSEVFIDIILLDVNDNAPVFEMDTYKVTLSESVVIGASVHQVKAVDADFVSNKLVSYELLEPEGSVSTFFQIDCDTGVISTTSLLDYETKSQHTLRLRAVDKGTPALTSEASLIIDVSDVNDNPPTFTQGSYDVAVSELATQGHFVLSVQAADADVSDAGKLEYFFLSGNERGHFALNKKTGQVVMSNHQRSGMQPSYSMNVLVTDGVFRSSAEVNIKVIRENLHSPTFAQSPYAVELPENSPIGTLVTEVKVTDRDEGVNGQVKYSIVSEVTRDKFAIDADGQIYTLESFDRENSLEKAIAIHVMAKDGGGKVGFCTVNVIITDMNDNTPQFVVSEYNVSVPWDSPTGMSIVKITAIDVDEGINADILYEIDSEVRHFDIHPQSGVITVKQSLFGFENYLYTLYVKARDSGTPQKHSFIPVNIVVVPSHVSLLEFVKPSLQLTIAEDLPVGTEMDVIQAEGGEPSVTYSLVRGNIAESNREDVFVIDSMTGVLKLVKRLDYESTHWYGLTVQASRLQEGMEILSLMEVTVELKDVNDNSPQFDSDPYEAYVVENSPRQTSVIQVRAFDLDTGTNGQVTYSLDESQERPEVLELFAVEETTGWLVTLRELDREQRERYTISVIASDQGKERQMMATAAVEVTVVDVNDNPPRFAEEVFKATAREDDSPSTVVAVFSIADADSEETNRQISCYITGGDPVGHFGIEQSHGEWRLTVRNPLDREKRDNYLLNLTATDGTHLARAAVDIEVLDANDNSPVCGKSVYAGTVPEDAPAGLLILQVSATDADVHGNAEITYQLSGDGAERFSLHPTTGELRSLLPLDREERQAFKLTAQAQDGGGLSCQVAVEIAVTDVNDNPPRFTPDAHHFSVAENTEPGTYVAQMQAMDPDTGMNGKILYSFEDSAGGLFSIQERSGIISLERSLDPSVQATYTLRVRATDQGTPRQLSSLSSATVTVRTAADSPPAFQLREYVATVPEDVSMGTQILRVFASGGDSGARHGEIAYSITGGNEQGAFSINSRTGDIFVIESLDYESSHEHFLTVEAKVEGKEPLSDIASVQVNVTDVNDNSPVFSQGVYSAVVSEDAKPGTAVVTITASDTDGPANNRVRFSIIGGNQGTPFIIDAVSGELRVARPLDREQESVPISSSILQLQATDGDAPHNGPPFTFSIVRGDERGAFQMDPQGTLTTRSPLSHRTQENYLLRVKVVDSGKPSLSATTVISIRVVEQSRHPPVVLPLEVIVYTPQDEFPGGYLGKVHATDNDPYDTLSYSLPPIDASSSSSSSPPPQDLFSVSPTDGRLLATRGLDAGLYPLNVSVSDGRFSASAPVSVHVRRATRRMLEHAVAMRVSPVTPEEFLTDHWRNVQRAVRNAAGARRGDIHLLSLQATEPDPGAAPKRNLDMLLSVEVRTTSAGARPGLQGALLHKINASLASLRQTSGLRVAHVLRGPCAFLQDCPVTFCRELAVLDQDAMSTHSSARLSFVSPRHHMSAICLCKDGKCPKPNSPCEDSPCPDGFRCVPAEKEDKYSCLCESSKKGNCSGGAALTLFENSFIKYHLPEDVSQEELKISLRLRTFSSHGTVMFAKGHDYSILEIVDGRLEFQFDCGSGQATVSVHSVQVNDGQWHSVWLGVEGNRAKLVLDRVHSASGIAPGDGCSLHLRDAVFLGGHAHLLSLRPRRSLPGVASNRAAGGLRGCIDSVLVNGQPLSLGRQSPSGATLVEDMVGVLPGCAMFSVDDCSNNPCLNGGRCTLKPNRGYSCQCEAMFIGTRCEARLSSCVSNPCLYGGTCVDNSNGDFYCQCRGHYSGQRCQIGPYCASSPCHNGGHCIESLDGAVCECPTGFTGERCQMDVDECQKEPCGNGGRCVNTHGFFHCICAPGFAGVLCQVHGELRHKYPPSPSWTMGLEEILGSVLVFVCVFLVLLLFAGCWRAGCPLRRTTRKKGEEEEGGEAGDGRREARAFLQRSYPDTRPARVTFAAAPPQVPIRPAAYTREDSALQGSDIPEYFESSVFHQDHPPARSRGERKPVAVCSVAPHLPSRCSPVSPTDGDSFHKPTWDYEDDAEPFMKKRSRSRGFNTPESCSPSSPRSESSDDNGYHWDISDWIPSMQLCHVQGLLHNDSVQTPPPGYIKPTSIDTDYLTSGLDIESEFTSALQYPADVHLPPVHLPPVLRLPESYSPMLPCRDTHPSADSQSSNCPVKAHCLIHRARLTTPLTQIVPQGSVSGPSDFNGQDRHSECLGQDDGDICLPMRSCSDVSAYGEDCDSMLSDSESSDGWSFQSQKTTHTK